MAVINLTYKIKLSREVPVVKMVMLKGEPGSAAEYSIENIQRNGVTLPINNHTVDIEVPTDTGDLTNHAGYVKSDALTNFVSTSQLDGILEDYLSEDDITGGVASGNNGLVTGGQVYTAIQNAINSIADGDGESY